MDMGVWLTAVQAHPDTLDTDVSVAIALANGDNHREGVTPEEFNDSVEELIALGFLDDVLSIVCSEPHGHGDGCDEHMLEFRLPEAAAGTGEAGAAPTQYDPIILDAARDLYRQRDQVDDGGRLGRRFWELLEAVHPELAAAARDHVVPATKSEWTTCKTPRPACGRGAYPTPVRERQTKGWQPSIWQAGTSALRPGRWPLATWLSGLNPSDEERGQVLDPRSAYEDRDAVVMDREAWLRQQTSIMFSAKDIRAEFKGGEVWKDCSWPDLIPGPYQLRMPRWQTDFQSDDPLAPKDYRLFNIDVGKREPDEHQKRAKLARFDELGRVWTEGVWSKPGKTWKYGKGSRPTARPADNFERDEPERGGRQGLYAGKRAVDKETPDNGYHVDRFARWQQAPEYCLWPGCKNGIQRPKHKKWCGDEHARLGANARRRHRQKRKWPRVPDVVTGKPTSWYRQRDWVHTPVSDWLRVMDPVTGWPLVHRGREVIPAVHRMVDGGRTSYRDPTGDAAVNPVAYLESVSHGVWVVGIEVAA
jgi:hypothetical protein